MKLGLGLGGVELTVDGGRSYDGLPFRAYDLTFMSAGDCDHFRKKALLLLAGGVAEKRLFELEGIRTDVDLSVKDDSELREHYEIFEGAAPPESLSLDLFRREAEEMIGGSWGRVRRLADHLLRCQRLTRHQVVECFLSQGIVWDDD